VSDLFRGDEKKKKEVEASGKVVERKKLNRRLLVEVSAKEGDSRSDR
jgi:hypothetical protein